MLGTLLPASPNASKLQIPIMSSHFTNLERLPKISIAKSANVAGFLHTARFLSVPIEGKGKSLASASRAWQVNS